MLLCTRPYGSTVSLKCLLRTRSASILCMPNGFDLSGNSCST